MKTAKTSKKTLLSRLIAKEEPKPVVEVVAPEPVVEIAAPAVVISVEPLEETTASSLSPSELTKETQ